MNSWENLQVFVGLAGGVLIGWIFLYYMMKCIAFFTPKKFTFRSVLENFGQKMWMTVGLGITFFGLYFIVVMVGSQVMDHKARLEVFYLLYDHPIFFINFGLLVFASCSLGIYLTRMLIKYLYNSRLK